MDPEKPRHRRRCPRDPASWILMLRTLPIAWQSATVAKPRTIARLLETLTARAGLPVGQAPARCRCAAARASRLLGGLGRLDSCIVRSLVVAVLLSDRPGVRLHVGFGSHEPGDGGQAEVVGHAWVTLDGELVSETASSMTAPPYTEAKVYEVRRAS